MMDWQARAEAVEQENDRLRDRIAALEDALGMTREHPPLLSVRFTPTEGQMLNMMLARGYVQRGAFFAMLYQTRPDGDDPPDIKIIDVLICKLRPKLKKLAEARIETKWGEGYFIAAEDKHRIRAALGEVAPDTAMIARPPAQSQLSPES